jgi:hypothetical protein
LLRVSRMRVAIATIPQKSTIILILRKFLNSLSSPR